jgi:hypothetical protein
VAIHVDVTIEGRRETDDDEQGVTDEAQRARGAHA